ncbi:peptidoglycan-binding protein [Streptomyces griseoloalbus]|uniref:peptidoglycan-binding domain-containing protein n=1 Tax=Streptomyces griseoloalbus TaxID=67303 RepID=UPI001874E7B7|nr:peptidoglycan-binding protein [Streptomyces griseoloalbus]
MEQPNEHPCPECGAPRNRDNTPSCACTLRASDAFRDARTAEAAAAEDFDPLRIRPYVELDGGAGRSAEHDGPPEDPRASERSAGASSGSASPSGSPSEPRPEPSSASPEGGSAPEPHGAPPANDATMTLRRVPPGATDAPGTPGTPRAVDSTSVLPSSVLPTPLAPATTRPSATDLHLFETEEPAGTGPGAPEPDGGLGTPTRRRRPGMLFAAAGAVVAVVGAAGWASGLFSYETPSRDGAAPQDIRAGVPDPSSGAPSAAPTTSASSAAPAPSASPSASPSVSASPSASPLPSASSTSPGPSQPAEPSSPPTTTTPSDAAEDTDEDDDTGGPVLRRGDRGPEVTELQLRLRQLYLYNDDVNGQFSQRLEESLRNYQWSRGLSEELSVYGPETRSRLESETREP